MTNSAKQRWELRILRARKLQAQFPAAAPPLRLYEAVLEFQSDVAARQNRVVRSDTPLRQQIDILAVCSEMPALLVLASKFGPAELQLAARTIRQTGELRWRETIASGLSFGQTSLSAPEHFLSRSCLQPVAEHLQLQLRKDPNYTGDVCPACGGLPQVAVLRPEGEGASRSLICSFCLREWTFRRIVCPSCGEEDKEKLARYSAKECKYVHVEACDSCRGYIKAVDMTVNGHAVPLVDEAALAVFDVWATQRGYSKLAPNLLGF
jgi:FdhE protein